MEAAIAARDPYTASHQRRVAQVAQHIGLEMGLSKDHLQVLWMAAVIHDLGKIAIPAEILAKPTKLTDIEFSLIKKHPEVAHSILRPIEFHNQMTTIILQHHERVNGSGYPFGLKEEEILLEAKILAVADVFEAMCSHRPYRPALGIELASVELRRNSGIFYDREVVEACLTIHGRGLRETKASNRLRMFIPPYKHKIKDSTTQFFPAAEYA
jgi:HD-GYP domain-containing protein (c-di-GMP phosphodiesterase class II)